MATAFLFQTMLFALIIILFYRKVVRYQSDRARLCTQFSLIVEFARQLGMYECREFLAVAQTGDQAELERRWPTWREFRDAGLRGDYAWGIA